MRLLALVYVFYLIVCAFLQSKRTPTCFINIYIFNLFLRSVVYASAKDAWQHCSISSERLGWRVGPPDRGARFEVKTGSHLQRCILGPDYDQYASVKS
uniref:Putative secreted protein n=1 Tax=Ixodes ricinus TaxID=34613 RepID=A0A6B0UDZ3_IXORI